MSNAKKAGELSQTCKTFLHEWYANDNEQIRSKYTDKGELVEDDLIDFMANQLGLGIAEKNRISMSDEFFTGTCDVDHTDSIIDVKASWNKKTLHQQILDGMDSDYEWQLQGYCHLYKKPKGILFFGLMDTPPDVNYGDEVIYSDLPDNERWVAYQTQYSSERIELVKLKVLQCRDYLNEYDALVKSKLGSVI